MHKCFAFLWQEGQVSGEPSKICLQKSPSPAMDPSCMPRSHPLWYPGVLLGAPTAPVDGTLVLPEQESTTRKAELKFFELRCPLTGFWFCKAPWEGDMGKYLPQFPVSLFFPSSCPVLTPDWFFYCSTIFSVKKKKSIISNPVLIP